jgi:hypothetical protein
MITYSNDFHRQYTSNCNWKIDAKVLLDFLKRWCNSYEFDRIITVREHAPILMAGWHPIISLICATSDDHLCEIDIRYGIGAEIFKQNLFDYGWSEQILLSRLRQNEPPRSKIIIYLCEASTGLLENYKNDRIADHFLISQYWQSVSHLYLQLPIEHPFTLPIDRLSSIVSGFSTNRCAIACSDQNNEAKNLSNLLPAHPQRIAEGGLRTRGYTKSTLIADQPLISVITVVFNGERYLEQTIQSVINQVGSQIEYIIIDGGSTDGTLEILRKYDGQIDYWVSEPDLGLYDAMNKGTAIAVGEYTIHINADDLLFESGALAKKYDATNILAGVFLLFEQEGVVVKSLPRLPDVDRDQNIFAPRCCHQAFLGLRTHISKFDLSYSIIADRIVMANKIDQEGAETTSNILAIARLQNGGISSDSEFKILGEVSTYLTKTNSNLRSKVAFLYIVALCRKIAKLFRLTKLIRKYATSR